MERTLETAFIYFGTMNIVKFIIVLCAICHISYISAQIRYLPEVFVDAEIVSQHGDTIAYRVSALKTDKDRSLEDLLRRIPGIEVQSNGNYNVRG